jgi:hypothetical protein
MMKISLNEQEGKHVCCEIKELTKVEESQIVHIPDKVVAENLYLPPMEYHLVQI